MAGPSQARRVRRVRRATAALLLGLLVLAGCSGDTDDPIGGGNSATAPATPAEWPDGVASLGILEAGVDVADEPAEVDTAAFRGGEDGEGLVASDLVRTDASGFAEVRWVEGALARVDVDTLLEVTELDLATGQPKVSTRLDVGRVWSRLDSGSADYSVATDVGTAAVRGTGFLVACDVTCTFGLVEGVVGITTSLGIELELRPGEQVAVDADGRPGEIEPFDYDDPWIRENLRRDELVGFAPVVRPTGGDDGRTEQARGRLDGSYEFSFVMQESNVAELEGQRLDRQWVYFPTCDTGPCGGEWDPGDGALEPFRWTGQSYTASWVDRPAGACPDGGTRWLEDFVLVATPTAVDGDGMVTALDATWESTLTPTQEAIDSGCDGGQEVEQFLTGTGGRTG